AASISNGSNWSGRCARTTSLMIHFVVAGKTITISVLKTAQVIVPAAIHGYRFRYAKTRQTVFIQEKRYQSPRITRMRPPCQSSGTAGAVTHFSDSCLFVFI